MNAAGSIPPPDSTPTDDAGDSDSDNSSDEILDYYQPISSSEADIDSNAPNSNGFHPIDPPTSLLNIQDFQSVSENGVRSLNLSDDQHGEMEVEIDEEEEVRNAELDSAMRRALEEDEKRRNAPLTDENARRVMDAMRGVSFAGLPPDWAAHDSWIDQVRSSRHSPSSTA